MARATPAVHLGKCEHVHGAVLQVLLALRPEVVCAPADQMLAAVLASMNRSTTITQPLLHEAMP
jgi:hypothetical protein